jgi:hypothetical protein
MSASIPIIDPHKDRQLQTQNELVGRLNLLVSQYVVTSKLTNLEIIGALDCVRMGLAMQTVEFKKAGQV